jgi:cation:H+ antiporter
VDPQIVVYFVAGGMLLVAGAELLVRGASRLAIGLGISPLVIGLTIVAYGTSSPELAVSIGSAYGGAAGLAMGNVVGSNIFNVLLILGLSALIAPLVVAQPLVRRDVPLMIGVSVLVLLLALDGRIGRVDGLLLTVGTVAYTVFLIRQSRRDSLQIQAEYEEAFGRGRSHARRWLSNAGLAAAGLVLLLAGARWLVEAAVTTASFLGVSDLVIGLTIVAAGTSLPEVATSVMASVRGERDIAVGNVVGSNIFNILAVLGVTAVVAPEGVHVSPGALTFDIPVMIAVAVATLPIVFTGYAIVRWEGAVFLAYYLAYMLYIVLDATEHAAFAPFSAAMAWFILPLTGLTLAVVTWRALGHGLGRAGH